MKTILLALLLFGTVSFAGPLVSFERLPAGDTIHVSYTSQGCFHSFTFEFLFQRGKTMTVEVTRIEPRWDQDDKPLEPERIVLGTIPLSETEVAGLDRLLVYYRAMHRGGSTTVDYVKVTQKDGKKQKASESFADDTSATHSMKELTLLRTLVSKFKSKAK
jgi:hypothetical protein